MEKIKALEAARQTLEMVIEQHTTRIKYHEDQAAHLQETIFVVFDDLLENNPTSSLLVGLEHKASYVDFGGDRRLQRQFLLRRQLRHEYQAKKLQQRVDELKLELLVVTQQQQQG